MVRAVIAGTGSYLPERVVTNDELSERMPKTSDEWIYSHTGIHSRHIAAPNESASDMGLVAAKQALEQAGVGADYREHSDARLCADASDRLRFAR